jgi:dienelactone hydrolase
MKRTPVFVPTSGSPVEAIVHEPEGAPIACAVALPGAMSRAEVNRKWARVADSVADLGIVVIRYNYLDGEDLRFDDARGYARAHEVIDWFHARTPGLDLLLLGHCHGARLCLSYAAANPARGVALVTPWLGKLGSNDRTTVHVMRLLTRVATRAGVRLPSRSRSLAPDTARDLAAIGSSPRPWILVGDGDYQWRSWANPATAPRELAFTDFEVVPNVQIFATRTLEGQDVMVERVTAWAARTLASRVES